MPRGIRRPRAVLVAAALACGAVTAVVPGASPVPVPVAHAADPPWTTPTVPPKCTSTQLQSGQVAGCVVMGGSGLPEVYGWPTPPFPTPSTGEPGPWFDLTIGSSGSVVMKVQQALQAAGHVLAADGQFGPITASKVSLFQTAQGLPVTGIVDVATVTALGVSNAVADGVFPPAGWVWLGWAYNGSPALAAWEQGFSANPQPIGSVKTGQMKVNPQVLPLFEGFISEIVARGYVIRDLGGYSFRCTASTAKSCAGLTRAALSNHAYGLAIDFNTAANPMATYRVITDGTACVTPMMTDIPRWVVQTAEKWGLYWGGYGWSSGCTSPDQIKSSASRDPMHFEFRGTPAQAKAILAANGGGQQFCLDLVDPSGIHRERCTPNPEIVPSGSRLLVDTGAPDGAAAALVNIALVGAAGAGYATAERCDAIDPGPRRWANGNTAPGRTASNLAVVRLDADGRFCLYLSTAMHAVVDVQGWFAPPEAIADGGSTFTPLAPHRVLDTRRDPVCAPDGSCGSGPVAAGSEVAIDLAEVPAGASAVLANFTSTGARGPGYLTADTCAALVPGPQQRANVNFPAAATVGNLGVVPVEAGSVAGSRTCVYAKETTDVVVDVQGYFSPATEEGLMLTVVAPMRLIDTRECWTDPVTREERCGVLSPAGSIVRIATTPDIDAVLVNLVLTGSSSTGYATADRCSALVPGPQASATASIRPGATVANLAVVPVDEDGSFCVYLSAATHLVIDGQGGFSTGGDLRFVPMSPERRLDTREPAPEG